jgi:hypothetical protein
MSIDRIVIGFGGSIILISVILITIISIKFIYLTAFIGFMMLQSTFTRFCPIAIVLKKLGFKSVSFF